ncbi:MAG: hypothetical protein EOO65_03715 [Methanosarcinales archaeon]|nr:MAG: hypothetical protein EOO65_03715 [Methanosarcinales archaeon]
MRIDAEGSAGLAAGAACSSSASCRSGQCASGRCCATATSGCGACSAGGGECSACADGHVSMLGGSCWRRGTVAGMGVGIAVGGLLLGAAIIGMSMLAVQRRRRARRSDGATSAVRGNLESASNGVPNQLPAVVDRHPMVV